MDRERWSLTWVTGVEVSPAATFSHPPCVTPSVKNQIQHGKSTHVSFLLAVGE